MANLKRKRENDNRVEESPKFQISGPLLLYASKTPSLPEILDSPH